MILNFFFGISVIEIVLSFYMCMISDLVSSKHIFCRKQNNLTCITVV